MKLYGSYTSPYVRHCRIVLIQQRFDFELVQADYAMSAAQSPTSKVPYFNDGSLTLTDSSSIIKYLREKAGQEFLPEIEDYELYAMTNTIVDATINLFLLANDGVGADKIPYLGRQQARVESGLEELNNRLNNADGIAKDSALRCACFIDWGLFRNRINIDGMENLQRLLAAANTVDAFVATAPPRSR